MKTLQKNTLVTYIDAVPDPRCEGMCLHNFIDILIIAISAVLCGVVTLEGMAKFGRKKRGWLSTFLELPNGIPSHDTFYRTFCLLDPTAFQECFTRWISDTFPAKGWMLSPLMESVSEAQEVNPKRPFIWY